MADDMIDAALVSHMYIHGDKCMLQLAIDHISARTFLFCVSCTKLL